MKKAFRREAPAKVNLALDILGRRPDGYHELRSVMQTVSLCDTVELREGRSGFSLLAEGFALPEPIGDITEGQITLWPQRQGTDGFYICRMRKAI